MTYEYCSNCQLSETHPGVELDSTGLCNLCRLELPQSVVKNFHYTRRNYAALKDDSATSGGSGCDLLLMYSGGKDSTYLLDKYVNEHNKNVLAYTFKVPFESQSAVENVDLVSQKISAEFLTDADDQGIRTLMAHLFNNVTPLGEENYLAEKLPCTICRSFFVLRAIVLAFERSIPYIVFGADPQQIITTESNVQSIVRDFYRVIGADLVGKLFDDKLEQLLFADDEVLPKIVFPYIATRNEYDPGSMVEELKSKGLYRTSPIETHCELFPLLNYYAFRNYDCSYYRLNIASEIRSRALGNNSGQTFSISFGASSDIVKLENEYKAVVMDIAARRGDMDAHRKQLHNIFLRMSLDSKDAEFLVDKFLSMHQVAEETGIRLAD